MEVSVFDPGLSDFPFGGELELDPWVCFHGTSSSSEDVIESEGLGCPEVYSRSEIDQLLRIFDEHGWTGSRRDGYPVLASFTQSDFEVAGGHTKPVFLSADSRRSLLYTRRDYAGGETARAIRLAFEDLHQYATDEEFRQKAISRSLARVRDNFAPGVDLPGPKDSREATLDDVRAVYRKLAELGGRSGQRDVPTVDFSQERLLEKLNSLADLQQRMSDLETSWTHGVIYAIRFSEADRWDMKSNYHSIFHIGALGPERLTAKAIIPSGVDWEQAYQASQGDLQYVQKRGGEGIVSIVRAASSS